MPSSEAAGVDEPGPSRPDHHTHNDAENSEEKEVEEPSSALYRAGGTDVNDECLRLSLSIGSVEEDLFRSNALALDSECKRFGE